VESFVRHNFCNGITLPDMSFVLFRECTGLQSVNTLHDVLILFCSLVYMSYLVFLRGLKHDEMKLKELTAMVRRLPRLSWHRNVRRRDKVARLRERVVAASLHMLLEVEVTSEGP
jgi:hypothetical protein